MDITFLGAVGTVTGSKYLVEAGGARVLVDCGLFQGWKTLRLRNWQPLPLDAAGIDAVVLTHAHLDHSGYLPVLVKHGFSGPVYGTDATRDLSGVLLPDSGHLQEEEARYANQRGYSRHKPALPLYTREEAERCLERFRPVAFEQAVTLGRSLRLTFTLAGHILGAACVHLDDGARSVVFSGDVGRPNDPIMRPPPPLRETDYLVIESTYGNRRHDPKDPEGVLADIVRRTADRGGVILVPAFAVGRAQTLLHLFARLKAAQQIPDVPVFLNSPMAINATKIFCAHPDEHRLSTDQCVAMCDVATYVNTPEESKALNRRNGPMIIISASGMATGGRILHHLTAFAPDPRNTVLFTGFQAAGTRGAAMLNGAETVKIHGELVPLRAEVAEIASLSAHGDYVELTAWLRQMPRPPARTFITHGEPEAAAAFKNHLASELDWKTEIPMDGARVALP